MAFTSLFIIVILAVLILIESQIAVGRQKVQVESREKRKK